MSETYDVERILYQRDFDEPDGRITKYLVKWTGYPDEECTWEPAENFDPGPVLSQWENQRRNGDILDLFELKSIQDQMGAFQARQEAIQLSDGSDDVRDSDSDEPLAKRPRLVPDPPLVSTKKKKGIARLLDRSPSPSKRQLGAVLQSESNAVKRTAPPLHKPKTFPAESLSLGGFGATSSATTKTQTHNAAVQQPRPVITTTRTAPTVFHAPEIKARTNRKMSISDAPGRRNLAAKQPRNLRHLHNMRKKVDNQQFSNPPPPPNANEVVNPPLDPYTAIFDNSLNQVEPQTSVDKRRSSVNELHREQDRNTMTKPQNRVHLSTKEAQAHSPKTQRIQAANRSTTDAQDHSTNANESHVSRSFSTISAQISPKVRNNDAHLFFSDSEGEDATLDIKEEPQDKDQPLRTLAGSGHNSTALFPSEARFGLFESTSIPLISDSLATSAAKSLETSRIQKPPQQARTDVAESAQLNDQNKNVIASDAEDPMDISKPNTPSRPSSAASNHLLPRERRNSLFNNRLPPEFHRSTGQSTTTPHTDMESGVNNSKHSRPTVKGSASMMSRPYQARLSSTSIPEELLRSRNPRRGRQVLRDDQVVRRYEKGDVVMHLTVQKSPISAVKLIHLPWFEYGKALVTYQKQGKFKKLILEFRRVLSRSTYDDITQGTWHVYHEVGVIEPFPEDESILGSIADNLEKQDVAAVWEPPHLEFIVLLYSCNAPSWRDFGKKEGRDYRPRLHVLLRSRFSARSPGIVMTDVEPQSTTFDNTNLRAGTVETIEAREEERRGRRGRRGSIASTTTGNKPPLAIVTTTKSPARSDIDMRSPTTDPTSDGNAMDVDDAIQENSATPRFFDSKQNTDINNRQRDGQSHFPPISTKESPAVLSTSKDPRLAPRTPTAPGIGHEGFARKSTTLSFPGFSKKIIDLVPLRGPSKFVDKSKIRVLLAYSKDKVEPARIQEIKNWLIDHEALPWNNIYDRSIPNDRGKFFAELYRNTNLILFDKFYPINTLLELSKFIQEYSSLACWQADFNDAIPRSISLKTLFPRGVALTFSEACFMKETKEVYQILKWFSMYVKKPYPSSMVMFPPKIMTSLLEQAQIARQPEVKQNYVALASVIEDLTSYANASILDSSSDSETGYAPNELSTSSMGFRVVNTEWEAVYGTPAPSGASQLSRLEQDQEDEKREGKMFYYFSAFALRNLGNHRKFLALRAFRKRPVDCFHVRFQDATEFVQMLPSPNSTKDRNKKGTEGAQRPGRDRAQREERPVPPEKGARSKSRDGKDRTPAQSPITPAYSV